MKVELSRIHYPVTTLGPGRRVGVWLQGCSIRCDGCISADTWGRGRGATTVGAVLEAVGKWLPDADGITVSGGEPFDQPNALCALLNGLRECSKADILVYSGYSFERLQSLLAKMPGLIDALITDPYDARAPQTLALRGSDNQRLHLLTPLGVRRFAAFDRPLQAEERALDVMVDADGAIWMAGIPRTGDLIRLQKVLSAAGHTCVTTQATTVRRREAM